MKLLALDLASRTGWACGDTAETGKPASGYHTVKAEKDDIGGFAKQFHGWLIPLLDEYQPEMLVFEAFNPHMGGTTTRSTTLKLAGLCYHVEFVAAMRGIRYREVHASTWKAAFAPGVKISKSIKPYPIVSECHSRGWSDVKDDNEADALGLWSYAADVLDQVAAAGRTPLFAGQAA